MKGMKPAHAYWTRAHQRLAKKEGWDIFTRSDGLLEIERIDEMGVFKTDDEALNHVRVRAEAGSPLHHLALQLDQRKHDRPIYILPAFRKPTPQPLFILIQQGGNSTEYYAHLFDTKKDALAHRKSCRRAAYTTHGPFSIPVTATLAEWSDLIGDILYATHSL